jgi:hypothetical protein
MLQLIDHRRTSMDSILEALKQIDASNTTYEEWIQIGMALKAEGYDCSVWDDWSKNDSRYKEGECDRKWGTFKGSSILDGNLVVDSWTGTIRLSTMVMG